MRDAPRILSIGATAEWHARIREQLRTAAVEPAPGGAEGRLLARDWKPDLVIVEAVLADMTGMAFCRGLREDPELRHLRLLVLSSQNSELDRVLAFECGADDFLPAPFSASRARRAGERAAAPRARHARRAQLAASRAARRARRRRRPRSRGGRRARGAAHAHRAARAGALILGRGKVLTRRAIVESLAGESGSRNVRVVDAHVKSLRRKLGEARSYIQSVRGVGYRFSAPGR